MNRLGSIAIRQPESVLEARKKIRLVTEAVTGDSLIATRLATVTSVLARRMARENTSPRIEVSIDDSQRCRVLSVDFVGQEHCPDAALLTSFFDDVETDGTNTVRGVLSLPGDLLLDDASNLFRDHLGFSDNPGDLDDLRFRLAGAQNGCKQ